MPHVSGELTRHWREAFSTEVVDAITHHDDGWAEWESGAEVESGERRAVLVSGNAARRGARDLGPLDRGGGASLGRSPATSWPGISTICSAIRIMPSEPPAIAWLTAKRKIRTAWLDEWVRADPIAHARICQAGAADVADGRFVQPVAVLRLPSRCDGRASMLEQSAMKLRTDTLLGQFQFASPEFAVVESGVEASRRGVGVDRARSIPIRSRRRRYRCRSKAMAVPVKRYANWQELVAASWPWSSIGNCCGRCKLKFRERRISARECEIDVIATLSNGGESG